jgi:hypothetical protein
MENLLQGKKRRALGKLKALGKWKTTVYGTRSDVSEIYDSMVLKDPAERTARECRALMKHFLTGFEGSGKVEELASLTVSEKLAIAKHLALQRVDWKGQKIVEQGAQGSTFYFIFKGTFSLWVNEGGRKVQVGSLQPGDSFGELALINNEERTASVIAEGPGELLVITKDTFNLIFRDRKINRLRRNTEFVARCSFFNDRKAWPMKTLEYVSRRLAFKTIPSNTVVWHAGDPICSLKFIPVVKRGEADLVVVLAPSFSPDGERGSGDEGAKIHIKLCTLGAGAVMLDHAVMEAVDTALSDKESALRVAGKEEPPLTPKERMAQQVKNAVNGKSGQRKKSQTIYGQGRLVSEDQPLVRKATLVTTSSFEVAWLSLSDFETCLRRRRRSMEEKAIEKAIASVRRETDLVGARRAAVARVGRVIECNLAYNLLAYPPKADLQQLCRGTKAWKICREEARQGVGEDVPRVISTSTLRSDRKGVSLPSLLGGQIQARLAETKNSGRLGTPGGQRVARALSPITSKERKSSVDDGWRGELERFMGVNSPLNSPLGEGGGSTFGPDHLQRLQHFLPRADEGNNLRDEEQAELLRKEADILAGVRKFSQSCSHVDRPLPIRCGRMSLIEVSTLGKYHALRTQVNTVQYSPASRARTRRLRKKAGNRNATSVPLLSPVQKADGVGRGSPIKMSAKIQEMQLSNFRTRVVR